MKTIPFVPACQNMEEIQKLAVLITDFIHPEMIVLFGRMQVCLRTISGEL